MPEKITHSRHDPAASFREVFPRNIRLALRGRLFQHAESDYPLMKTKQEQKNHFPIILNEIMQKRQMTQSSLAEEAHTSQSNISRYMRGDGMPRAEELYRISKCLGVTMEWLLTGESQECQALAPPVPAPPGKQAKVALAQIEAGLAKLRASLDA